MRTFIWGTGRAMGAVVGRYIELDEVEAFIDNDRSKHNYMGKTVIPPEEITQHSYDAILVANQYREEIMKQCMELGINLEKVIFLYNNCILEDVNKDYEFVARVLGKKYADIVKNRYHVVRRMEGYDKPFEYTGGGYGETDYVRMECFDLAVKEINKRKLSGNVAEVGVFRGEFAQYINSAFPDKKLYLFDTFDGFDADEALREMKNGNCSDAFVEAYKQTNVMTVLNRMKYLDNVIIKQGFFPESINGLEDVFAFVSIDVDFEQSIYEGLDYFYPRLEKGGYIFIHDYNGDLRGVEKAVDQYEKDNEIMLCKMPLCDAGGTLVVMK